MAESGAVVGKRDWDVVVFGGGGLQARALFEAAARGSEYGSWLAVDRVWGAERKSAVEAMGVETATADLLADDGSLARLVGEARLAVNLAGPYYRTGTVVLDACIEAGCDYLDICDDADATLELLKRQERAKAAGVRALIGMGSSPGVTNVLVRTAFDALGGATEVLVAWIVDVADVNGAAVQHFFHIFSLFDGDGDRRPVAAWENQRRREVEFPDPIGRQWLVELAHPEPVTLPRFLSIDRVENFGSVLPEDAFAVTWALARAGGADAETIELGGAEVPLLDAATGLYRHYQEARATTPYRGGGMVVEVANGDAGLRFSSGWSDLTMEESTGTPAAAGISLMLAGSVPDPGVFVPECVEPASFFPALGRVSRNTGSLQVHRTERGRVGEELRLRDLIGSAAR